MKVVIPEALGPDHLDDCEIGSKTHEDVLVARLIRFTNLQIQYNHHTAEKWVRVDLPTCLDDSDEFITNVKARLLAALNLRWQTALHVDRRVRPGSILFLMVPGSPAAAQFAEAIARTNQKGAAEGGR